MDEQVRHNEHESEVKGDLINRLKSVSGHVNAVTRMVEDNRYCIDVIHQINAIQAALNKVSILILEDHMHTCVIDAVQSEDVGERERVLDEIRDVFEARSKL